MGNFCVLCLAPQTFNWHNCFWGNFQNLKHNCNLHLKLWNINLCNVTRSLGNECSQLKSHSLYKAFCYSCKIINRHTHIASHVCSSQIGSMFWGVRWSLVYQGLGDAKEGLSCCSLEVVCEEDWIDQVQDKIWSFMLVPINLQDSNNRWHVFLQLQ